MNILIINGPNINMIGLRNKNIYGDKDYHSLLNTIQEHAKKHHISVEIYQTNHEGDIIDYLQTNIHLYDGLIINPGALTHYSYAIRDALEWIEIPIIEVHLSNIYMREPFRHLSVIEDVVDQTIVGKGFDSYLDGLDQIIKVINHDHKI